jgi:hypothetical protein
MTPQESKINELLSRIQDRLYKIRELQVLNLSDQTRIRLIEEGVRREKTES